MSAELDQLLKDVKADSLKAIQALLVSHAEKHLPVALDIAAAEIKGPIDDVIIAALKPALIKAAVELAKKIYTEPVVA
ncbi:MAG: hypothetical protein ACK5UJ_01860 [Pseudobdellovibrionaceae bacterium]